MKKRFDFSAKSAFAKMSCLLPSVALSQDATRPSSIASLALTVPRVLPSNELNTLQITDDQWCRINSTKFPDEIKNMDMDQFWINVGTLTDISGSNEFKEISKFALDVLALPHSSASCERVFSKINLTKTRVRNRLVTDTVNALLLSSQCVSVAGGCDKFQPTNQMISLMNNKSLYPEKVKSSATETNTEAEEDEVIFVEEF